MASDDYLCEILDGVLKEFEALTVACEFASGPLGMVGGEEEAFGMGHQAEDSAGWIAEAGDVPGGAIGIGGVGDEGVRVSGRFIGVLQGDLSILLPLLERVGMIDSDATFGMGDGKFDVVDVFQEDAVGLRDFQFNPERSVAAVFVPGESCFAA